MMKRFWILFVALVVIFGGAMLLLKGASAEGEQLPDPTVYLSGGTFVITSTAVPVAVNSQTLTQTVEIEGYVFWGGPSIVPETVVTEILITAGTRVEWVSVWDLRASEVYTDENGVNLMTNGEDWGQTGLAVYRPQADFQVYTLSGWGYNLQVPEGTKFWNYESKKWQTDGYYGYFTSLLVPIPVPEPPVSTPTPESESYTIFLPFVSSDRPPACLETSPFEVLGWQVPEGYAVCSWQNPGTLQGIEPVRVQHERYNWIYGGIVGPSATWLSPGEFADGLILLATPTQAGVSVVCSDTTCPEGFRRVYAFWGFSYELSWWPLSGF
jgi:hypothetical protein